MNNIKFRAWYINSKSWWTNSVTISADGKIFVMCVDDKNQFHCFSKSPKDIVIQQFTGLFDKNGKEIYEGDIILESYNLQDNSGYNFGDIEKVNNKIIINYDAPSFNLKDKISSQKYIISNYSREVIGNIFENPELLNHES